MYFKPLMKAVKDSLECIIIIHNFLLSKTKHWKKLFRRTLKVIRAISKEMM